MEERQITEQEGLKIIASMITSTRKSFEVNYGNLFLNWGLLAVAIGVLTWIGSIITTSEAVNLIWLLMPVGFIFTRKNTNQRNARGYKSFTDDLTIRLWRIVWIIGVITVVFSAILFFVSGNTSCWFACMLFAFIIVGMGASFTGVLLNVKTMALGGAFSAICGMSLVIFHLSGLDVVDSISLPLLILSFLLMMVIPGLEIRNKAKEDERA